MLKNISIEKKGLYKRLHNEKSVKKFGEIEKSPYLCTTLNKQP